MKITVGIPTYNRPIWLLSTINEVLRVKGASVLEVIIVDQTIQSSIESNISQKIYEVCLNPLVKYFHINTPSLPLARNKIIKEAKGDIIVWLDDDVLLPDYFFEEHLRVYSDPNIIGCAGECHHRLLDVNPEDINFENYKNLTVASFDGIFTRSHQSTMVGANHSVLTEYCLQIQGCDESFIGSGYYSDADFTDRLRLKFPTKKIAYNPNAFVLHLKVPTGGCKVDGNKRSEYANIAPYILYCLRNNHGLKLIYQLILLLRAGPLRKYNVLQFWKIPYSLFIYIYAIIILYPNRNKIISSLHKNI